MSSMGGKQDYYGGGGNKSGPTVYFLAGAGVSLLVVALVLIGVAAVKGVPRWDDADVGREVASSESSAILPVPERERSTALLPLPGDHDVPQVTIPRATLPSEPPAGIGAAAVAPPVEPEEPAADVAGGAAAELSEQERAELFEREVAFMEERFFQVKDKMLVAIDTYYLLPEDQRLRYIQEFMRQLEAETAVEREAAGLPARPGGRAQQRLGHEFMRTFAENSTPEEKTKVNKFIGDMVQDGVRQWQRDMEARANAPQ